MSRESDPDDALSKPREAAQMFGVRPTTIARWTWAGLLRKAVRTLGGHRRYRLGDIRAVLEKMAETDPGQEKVTGQGIRDVSLSGDVHR
jgi:hypothetical protein